MSFFVTGSTVKSYASYDMHKKGACTKHQGRVIASAESFGEVDVTWLPLAAETYHISPKIGDYIVNIIPIVTADFPNRNLQAFKYTELTSFDPVLGRVVFATFKGKPCHMDHVNEDPTKAKGIVLDASLRHIPKYDVWKVLILAAWDRSKDTKLVNDILNKRRSGYSMGCMVEEFRCSLCEHNVSSAPKFVCDHFTSGKGAVIGGKLVYENCFGCNYIENSSVADPADTSAYAEDIWAMV